MKIRRSFRSKALGQNLVTFGVIVFLLMAWEGLSGRVIAEDLVSKPSDVLVNLFRLFQTGVILPHIAMSAQEFAIGYGLGVTLGCSFGFFLGRNQLIAQTLEPFLLAAYSVPRIALMPLLIVWLGIGIWPKVLLITLLVFFLNFFTTYGGVKDIKEEWITMARLMGANRWLVFRKILLPATLPFVMLGLRTGIPYGIIGIVVGEMVVANRGLGYYVLMTATTFDVTGTFSALVILVGASFIMDRVLIVVHRRVQRWTAVGVVVVQA